MRGHWNMSREVTKAYVIWGRWKVDLRSLKLAAWVWGHWAYLVRYLKRVVSCSVVWVLWSVLCEATDACCAILLKRVVWGVAWARDCWAYCMSMNRVVWGHWKVSCEPVRSLKRVVWGHWCMLCEVTEAVGVRSLQHFMWRLADVKLMSKGFYRIFSTDWNSIKANGDFIWTKLTY